jgi:predicted transcriptional regulator
MEKENQFDDLTEKATIAAISKRKNAMKILLFLTKDERKEEAYYLQKIADYLEMNETTAFTNLSKLIDSEIVEKVDAKGNRKNKYYIVSNKKLAEKAIEKYKYWVGFRLARLVPYNRLYCSQLKRDERFIKACEEYGLSLSEGIYVVLSCYKIGKENSGTETILWRKEQGYNPPEKEKPGTEVEEIF